MAGIRLREALTEDIPRLLELEQEIIEAERPYDKGIKQDNVTYYDLENLISNDNSYLVVVESNREIIGSGYAQIRASKSCFTHNHHCYLGFIFVDSAYRGKALGQKVVNTLKSWGQDKGVNHFHLDVYAKNESAIRAYEKAGFSRLSVKMELIE